MTRSNLNIAYSFDKAKKILIKPVALFLLVIALINLYFLFEVNPMSNDECLWRNEKISKDSVGTFFSFVKFEGVSWKAGIRDGDELLAINNVDVSGDVATAQRVLNKVEGGDSALYKIKRNGRVFETKVEVKKLLNFQGVAFSLLGLIWLIVGYIVVMAKPNGIPQRLFFRIAVMLILFNMVVIRSFNNPYIENSFPMGLSIIIDLMSLFGVSFFPFVLIHFFWVFPKPNKFIDKKVTQRFLYLGPTVIYLLALMLYFSAYMRDNYIQATLYFNLMSWLSSAAIVVGLISLFVSYQRLKTQHERNAIFVILITYALGVAAIIYYTTAIVTAQPVAQFNSPEYFMPIILIVLLPISFGYSIFKYSLMDVSDVIKNTIMYTAATITLAALYFVVIYVLGQSISSAIGTEYQGIIAGIIFIGFALIFQSTKDRFQEVITSKFYPEQFAFQKVLVKFSSDISTIVGMDNILDSVVDTFINSLKLKKVAILLKSNGDDKACTILRAVGIDKSSILLEEKETQIRALLNEKVKLKLNPVIEEVDFKKIYPESAEQLKEEGIYTIIPLMIKNKIIGLVLFGLKHSGAQFAGKDLELLSAACNQIAAAIENARLYEAEAEKLKIDRDLENAKRIQISLLPNSIPNINGLDISGSMHPAMQVGGDYYDIIRLDEKRVFVIIGDVSGKGLAASFYMSKLETMIKLFCSAGRTPKEVLVEVNKKITPTIERNWFITVSIALFNTETKKINYCRAGHTPLLVAKDFHLDEYIPKGIGIGMKTEEIFDNSIEEIELPLAAGQLFAFYSDGITEAMNKEKDLFGDERFKSILKQSSSRSAMQVENEIMHSLKTFRESEPQNDDITLVLVKVK